METTSTLIEEQMRTVVVGVADFKISTDPLTYLVTYALGSCLGVTFYDEKRRIGGLLHAMLPTATRSTAWPKRSMAAKWLKENSGPR